MGESQHPGPREAVAPPSFSIARPSATTISIERVDGARFGRRMERRPLGSTGLLVPVLGFGSGHIGGDALGEAEAGRLLGAAVDGGVTFIDTARSYGAAEERIGRHLAHRRHELILSTKGGYGIAGVPDWSAAAVSRGIDAALRRLRVDCVDIFHL